MIQKVQVPLLWMQALNFFKDYTISTEVTVDTIYENRHELQNENLRKLTPQYV